MKKIMTIIGARPQIIKAAAISRAIQNKFNHALTEVLVHTGQHYDHNMSSIFFDELEIPQPHYNLNTGSGQHGAQTAKMLEGIENIILKESPDAVLVYGDTNSTIAGALAASKLHIPLIHVEAGLRSYNKSMPEEINRILCDHASTLLFSPTESGIQNLIKEGFSATKPKKVSIDQPGVFKTGDVMFDNSLFFAKKADEQSKIISNIGLSEPYVLCTIHRDSNTDDADNLNAIFRALNTIQKKYALTLVLPLHPRTQKMMGIHLEQSVIDEIKGNESFKIIDPAGFIDMIALEKNARLIVTDSGGVQKEAFFFKKPCVILRPQTEWIEIVENGNAILADANEEAILNAFEHLFEKNDFTFPPFYGTGQAAEDICELIIEHL